MTQNSHYKAKTAFITLLLSLIVLVPASVASKPSSTKTLRSMSRAYMAFGKYEKAHKLAAKALKKARAENSDPGETALCLIDLATVCSYENLLSDAVHYYEKGVILQKSALFDTHPYVAQTLRMLSDVYRRQGNIEQSESALTEAVKIMLDNCSVESKEMAPFILEAGNLKFAKGQYELALGNYLKALDIFEQNYGPKHLMTANVLEKLARVHLLQENPAQADIAMKESLQIKSGIFGRYHPNLIDSWLEMARICKSQGKMERCEYYLAKSTETASQSNNVITMARVYEQVNAIRKEGLVAAVVSSSVYQ